MAVAVMAAKEEDMEVEEADMAAVAVEVTADLVEIPTGIADQFQLKKAKKLTLRSTPLADEETE